MEEIVENKDHDMVTKQAEKTTKKKKTLKKNASCNVRCEVCQVNFTDIFSLETHINNLKSINNEKSEDNSTDVKCNELTWRG